MNWLLTLRYIIIVVGINPDNHRYISRGRFLQGLTLGAVGGAYVNMARAACAQDSIPLTDPTLQDPRPQSFIPPEEVLLLPPGVNRIIRPEHDFRVSMLRNPDRPSSFRICRFRVQDGVPFEIELDIEANPTREGINYSDMGGGTVISNGRPGGSAELLSVSTGWWGGDNIWRVLENSQGKTNMYRGIIRPLRREREPFTHIRYTTRIEPDHQEVTILPETTTPLRFALPTPLHQGSMPRNVIVNAHYNAQTEIAIRELNIKIPA